MTLEAEQVDLIIVQVYMSTYMSTSGKHIQSLENVIGNEKGASCLLIMADWNAVVGEGWQEKCMGDFGLDIQNDRRTTLVEFCNRQTLIK